MSALPTGWAGFHYKTMITIKCQQCGKEFQNYVSNHRRFCSNKCKYASKERARKISKALKGNQNAKNKHWIFTKEHKRKLSESHKGIKYPNRKRPKSFTLSHRQKIGKASKGEKNGMWRGGITPLKQIIKTCLEYRQWQRTILKRDNRICQKCEETNGRKLITHHIKDFSEILYKNNIQTLEQALNCQELWDINNGITLCQKCHKLFHKIYGKTNNTREQLEEFLTQPPCQYGKDKSS